jgi:zinc protease
LNLTRNDFIRHKKVTTVVPSRKAKIAGLMIGALLACTNTASVQAGPEVESWRAASGARVLYVASRALPMLDVAVDFPGGSSRDVPEKTGLASMTLRMMRKGTTSLDENRISEDLAAVGARLSRRFDLDRSGYVLRTLSDKDARDSALGVLRDIVASPSFPADVLEREKSRTIAFIDERSIRPGVIAAQTFNRMLYGEHPYGAISTGTPESVAALSRADLVAFHRQHYVAQDAVVTIVGDVSKQEAQRIAENITRGLPRANGSLAILPPVPALTDSADVVIPHAASQAHIYIGMPGVRRGDPDYFPLWIAGQILGGGGMTSMLNEELREKRGLTYSAYSYFSPYLLPGPFTIRLQTRKDQAWEALDVAKETLERFIAEGPTEKQLQAAKRYVIGGFALNIDSNAELVGYLAMVGFYQLPLDYLDRFPEQISKVTLSDVQDALRRRLAPSQMVTVVVGPTARP